MTPAARATAEAAYIAGLDAAADAINDDGEYVRSIRLANRITALRDPAHVATAVAKIMKGQNNA